MASAAVRARLKALRRQYHLGEFSSKARKSTTHKKARKSRRVHVMARKKGRGRSKNFFGGGSVMKGLAHPTGFVGAAILGAGASSLIENTGFAPLGDNTGLAAGFVVGGVAGAAGAYVRNMLKGGSTSTNSATGGAVR